MSPSPRRRQLRRFRTSLASVLAALLVAVLIGPLAQLAPSYAGPAAQVGSTSSGQQTALARSVCGTWVLYQVSDARSLRILRPKIANALALPGVVGLSVRFPWKAVDLRGREKSHPILRTARKIASRAGKGLSIRFMAGTHTPERVFRAGASYYRVGGQRAPLAFDNGTGRHAVFVRAYEKYVHKLAAWSRRNDVRLLHLSWYGEDWSELNHGAAVRAAPGYTERKWLRGHRQLVRHRRRAHVAQTGRRAAAVGIRAAVGGPVGRAREVRGPLRRPEQPAVLRPGERLGRDQGVGFADDARRAPLRPDLAQAGDARAADDPARRLPVEARLRPPRQQPRDVRRGVPAELLAGARADRAVRPQHPRPDRQDSRSRSGSSTTRTC